MKLTLDDLSRSDSRAHRELLAVTRTQAGHSAQDAEMSVDELFSEMLEQTEIYMTPEGQLVSYWEDPHAPFNAGDDAYMIWDNGSGLWIPLEDQGILAQIHSGL